MKAFKILRTRPHNSPAMRPGVVVYPFRGCDYGCSADDTRCFGEPFGSFTLRTDGEGPFETFPLSALERIL